jgi:chromosome segregation ATPase
MPRKTAPSLVKVLEETRPAIQSALAEAEQELAELNDRRTELEGLIARARSVLTDDQEQAPRTPAQRLTLHEAMEHVLDEQHNRWMTVHELADAINERKLYEKRDRSPVEPSQIHARANKYPGRFEKDGPRVRRIAAQTQT